MTGVSNTREISLGEGFGDVALKVNGVRIEVHGDGSVDVYGNAPVAAHPGLDRDSAANDSGIASGRAPPQVGDKMPDGTVYAGISPDTGEPMYAASDDAPLTMKWKDAMEFAAKFKGHGHQDWRLPTKAELNVLFNNRATIGGFDVSGQDAAGWYWSATSYVEACASDQYFSSGYRGWHHTDNRSSVRLVRG